MAFKKNLELSANHVYREIHQYTFTTFSIRSTQEKMLLKKKKHAYNLIKSFSLKWLGHINRSPRRFHYGSSLTDGQVRLVLQFAIDPIRMHDGVT